MFVAVCCVLLDFRIEKERKRNENENSLLISLEDHANSRLKFAVSCFFMLELCAFL